ncbi:MAG: hypothetical protein JKY81_02420 [Colwellia sp.]|nr:hypothetical protein [Colwellia sp.]
MLLEVNHICGKLTEVSNDERNTGTMDAVETLDFAMHLIDVASELLAGAEAAGLENKKD